MYEDRDTQLCRYFSLLKSKLLHILFSVVYLKNRRFKSRKSVVIKDF